MVHFSTGEVGIRHIQEIIIPNHPQPRGKRGEDVSRNLLSFEHHVIQLGRGSYQGMASTMRQQNVENVHARYGTTTIKLDALCW